MKSVLPILFLGIAAYVLKADGAYRTADENGFTYLLLFYVRKKQTGPCLLGDH